jgi:hypothetical protein
VRPDDTCCTCEGIREIIRKELAKLDIVTDAKAPAKKRKKRAPSVYNLHMKACLTTMKETEPGMEHRDRFSACVAAWREKKRMKGAAA